MDRPTGSVLLPLLGHVPAAGDALAAAATARIIGRSRVGIGVRLGAFATLRGDGNTIEVDDASWFGERATVHIAHEEQGSRIGRGVTVGRSALVHAARIDDGAVVCAGAVVMDDSHVGPGAVIDAGALVPPRKTLQGGWLYAGVPAQPVRALVPGELEAIRARERSEPAPLTLAPDRERAVMPSAGRAFVADTAHFEGQVKLGAGATVWFGTTVLGREGRVIVGADSNVQDNTVASLAGGGLIEIGQGVTIGHNASLAACRIEDGALVGMGSSVAPGTVIEEGACLAGGAATEPNAVVTKGWLWAGRPARPVRALHPREQKAFAGGVRIYAGEYLDAFCKG